MRDLKIKVGVQFVMIAVKIVIEDNMPIATGITILRQLELSPARHSFDILLNPVNDI